ncbi:MAG TPA: squalene/phytoene synthase family protein [Afifellaceae bacterium]|nr:squalene/phytoene synthase family protein [Afifellaceae bacterium]
MTVSGKPSSPGGDSDYIASLVRSHDRPRYYSALFAPAGKRQHLMALYAANTEIRRIPESVSEPGLGEIRLQWWHDAIAAAGGGGGETPVMRALGEAIRTCRLPQNALEALVEARRGELYSDAPPTLEDLEGHYGATESALFQLACLVLGSKGAETADAAGHAGIAYGLATDLAGLPAVRRAGRQIASADLLEIYDVDAQAMFGETPPDAFEPLFSHLVDHARRHLASARAAVRSVPGSCRPAFLPLASIFGLLARVHKDRDRIWTTPSGLSDLAVLLRTTRAALFGV